LWEWTSHQSTVKRVKCFKSGRPSSKSWPCNLLVGRLMQVTQPIWATVSLAINWGNTYSQPYTYLCIEQGILSSYCLPGLAIHLERDIFFPNTYNSIIQRQIALLFHGFAILHYYAKAQIWGDTSVWKVSKRRDRVDAGRLVSMFFQ
jgi:hypothetical protein